MSIKKNDSLSKSELIIKLEAILALHNKAIAIKRKMNNFVPEDNYERKVVVPGFPGEYEDEEDREYFESAVRHEENDAIEQMSDVYDDQYHPEKPAEPKKSSYSSPDNQDIKNKAGKLGCFSYVAIGISIFFVLGSIFGVDENTADVLPTIYLIAAIGAVAFVVLRLCIKRVKAAGVKAEAQARSRYDREIAEINEKHNAAMKAYESECISYRLARQEFLDEYGKWREVYIESLKEEAEIEKQLEKDRLAAVEKINDEEFMPVFNDIAELNDLVTEEYLPALDVIIELLRSGRADDLKEAINLYENILYRERQLQLEREREENRRREAAQKQAAEERYYREQMEFQKRQEYARQREVERQQEVDERRHREEMQQREKQERDRRYEEDRLRQEQQRREERAELERKRQESTAIRHQCNTCVLTSQCSMAYRRSNCASYRPR